MSRTVRTIFGIPVRVQVAALILGGALSAASAGSQTGTVQILYGRSDGLHLVTLSGAHMNKPACASWDYWIIKNESTSFGRSQFATLLAAKLSGDQVSITGDGTCSRWPDGEDIQSVYIDP